MKATAYSIVFAVFAFCSGCQRQPVASFDTGQTEVEVGQVIKFQNQSTDADSYSWDFGDGSKTDEHSPSKVYNKEGLFRVRLVAYSKNKKKSDVEELSILVDEKLNAHFVGVHNMAGQQDEQICQEGSLVTKSSMFAYKMTIRAGLTDDEIFLDNVGGKAINNLRARIEKFTFGPFDTYSFSAVPGQQLADSTGNLWDIVMVSGDRDKITNCLNLYIAIFKTTTCNGSDQQTSFSADASACF